ncbi:hypothetical protein GKC56_06915 [Neisseriaceae bacterium PsAf]|nr:hypothetical protein [Neisseriaceae bacterium PsAf]
MDDARQIAHQIIKNLLLVRVRFLFKYAAYKEEQECRICDIDSNKGKTIFDIRDNAIKNTYVEYDPDIRDFIKEIKFGNNVHEQEKN